MIYTGLHQTPEQIAETALQEDVDAVGLSLLSGAHLTLFPRVMEELRNRDLGDVLVFGGGVIPDADIATLKEQGVAEVFSPGIVAGRRSAGGWKSTTRVDPRRRDIRSRWTCSSTRASSTSPGSASRCRPAASADTVDEAVAAADAAGYPVVVKAQVQVGGRGKAGGIKLANDADEVRTHAGNILGMDIKGHVVKRVWVEHASDIAEEYYASFTLDRSAKKHLLMLSAQGGVEIEEVAGQGPRRHRPAAHRPGRRALARTAASGGGRGGRAQPRCGRRRGRHPRASCTAASSRATATWPRSTR